MSMPEERLSIREKISGAIASPVKRAIMVDTKRRWILMLIDFHTHAFPPQLAARALEKLSRDSGGLQP